MVQNKSIRIGTRGSALALLQTNLVLSKLQEQHPEYDYEIVQVRTSGDINSTGSLQTMGLGVFVKEIERQLLDGIIDMAVHSLKDLPTEIPERLEIKAVLEREDPRDIQVNTLGAPLRELPDGFSIGTSSPRRKAQISSAYPHLSIIPLRGNIETRLNKSSGLECNGAVLAAAGLIRLNLTHHITEFLPIEEFVPPPGQGVIAVETRTESSYITECLTSIDHAHTRAAITAERLFLSNVGGGCQTPLGAHATIAGNNLTLRAFLGSEDGTTTYNHSATGQINQAQAVADEVHSQLISAGAKNLLKYK